MLNVHCSICQESFRESHDIAALLCGHVFHYECIKSWLGNKSNCPQCRSPNTANYIKKLFFDKVSDVNISIMNVTDSNSEYLLETITKLHNEIDKLNNSKDLLSRELSQEKIINKNLSNDLSDCQDLQKSEYLQFTNQIYEKDEVISKQNIKLTKLKFLNDILNKSSNKINSEVLKLSKSNDIDSELDKLCSAIVCCKADLDFYKDKSEQLSKELSRLEIKNSLLNSKLEESRCENDGIASQKTTNDFLTPTKQNTDYHFDENLEYRDVAWNSKLKRKLSTPQALLLSSPDTPGIVLKRRMNQETIASNPFACSNKKKTTNSIFDLSIMKKHQTRSFMPEPKPTANLRSMESENMKDNEPKLTKNPKVPRSKFIQSFDRSKLW